MLKLGPKFKKTIKYTLITLGILLLLFIILIFYLVFKDLKQESILEQEIMTYSNKELATDDYTIEIKTTGDYAHVEKAVKKYYKELSDSVKEINSYLNDEKLMKILSTENIISDRPDYSISHSTIKITKNKINEAINSINKLCNEDTIKGLLDKEKLVDEEYYYDLFLQYMYTEQDKKYLESLREEMKTISDNINKCLDKIDEILIFLQTNDSTIECQGNYAYFNSDTVLMEYKKLISELAELESEISKKDSSTDKTNEI